MTQSHLTLDLTALSRFQPNPSALHLVNMATQRFSSEAVDVSPLGAPLTFAFASRTAKNRFLKASMTERQSSWSARDLSARGIPSKELINVYRRWGEGGFGVVLTGNVMIEPDQLEAAGNAIVPRGAPF